MVNSKWPLALLLLTPHLFAETNVDSSSINVSSVEIKIATPDIELEEPTFSNLDKQPDNQTELMYGDFSGHYLGKKYQFIFERTSWHQAKEKAETMGGHLACIDTPEKLDYIHSLRTIHGNLNPVWIGLTDQDHEGRWRWLCNKPLNGKMRAWLNRGEGLDSRDYGHLMGKKPSYQEPIAAVNRFFLMVLEVRTLFMALWLNLTSLTYHQYTTQ